MSKTVVIHQPDFMPYIGFFHKLLNADLWIVFDDVQFLRRGWHHRDKIKTAQGTRWLTISINKAPMWTNINQITISNNDLWKEKHLDLLKSNYVQSPYFFEIYPYIEDLYAKNHTKLIDFNMASIIMLMKLLDVSTDLEFSSQHPSKLSSNERLIDLLITSKASHYLTGFGAKNYLKPQLFKQADIEVIWQNFCHPEYPQQYNSFIPNLSSIDLLLNCGIDTSRQILRDIQ